MHENCIKKKNNSIFIESLARAVASPYASIVHFASVRQEYVIHSRTLSEQYCPQQKRYTAAIVLCLPCVYVENAITRK